MKRLIKDLDATLSDRRFPVNLLAFLAIFTIPSNLEMPVIALIVWATVYRQLRTEPESLRERQWWKHPSWQRLGTYGGIAAVVYLVRAAAEANLFDMACLPFWCSGPFFTLVAMSSLFASVCAIAIRSCPANTARTSKQQDHKALQRWANNSYAGFLATFFCLCGAIAFAHDGVGTYIANWLIASGRDANLWGMSVFGAKEIQLFGTTAHTIYKVVPPPSESLTLGVQTVLALLLSTVFWPRATRLAGLLTTFCKRLCGRQHGHNFVEVFLRTLKEPRVQLKLKSKNAFLRNVTASLVWLVACYLLLFGFFGFSTGPIGYATTNFMDSSLADAHTGMMYGATANPHLRIFCAAIVALYSTVPFAVMSCVFLPYFRPRQIIINDEGLLLPDGLQGFLGIRLWSDFAHVDVRKRGKGTDYKKASLLLRFHSAGKIVLAVRQLSNADMEKLLSSIDEHATECVVTDAVVSLRAEIRRELNLTPEQNELGAMSPEGFQSTIFVPHEPGSWLPNGESRVVRLLATRPLSCVYLVRMESGKLAIAKQFFLAEDNEQTRALRKCFEREYELLNKIDHQAVSKVLDVFHKDESTYLLVEHAAGLDLRSLVTASGPQSEELVIEWALQLCDAMIYLHGQDVPIIHRDLTPDNVIIGDDGLLRIIDFGAAHQFLEGITGTIIGKQCYVSPEQLRGHAGPTSDIYSFGCMLNFLLTGTEPVALMQCSPKSKIDVSDEFNALVEQCTEFEECKRPRSFADIKERLLEIKKSGYAIINLAAEKDRVLTV